VTSSGNLGRFASLISLMAISRGLGAMPRKISIAHLVPAHIDTLLYVIRGQRVMLDSDLSKLYRVATKVLNQAVERNRDRFPNDFAFRLTPQEFENLRSQIVTSSSAHGGRRYLPRVFTEQGVAMLSSVLRSPVAVRVNVEIMRAFVRIRRLLATPGELVSQLQQLAETVQLHDSQIRDIAEVLRKMIEPPPPDGPKRRFGFHPPESAREHDTWNTSQQSRLAT
jgi:ORF6N domain